MNRILTFAAGLFLMLFCRCLPGQEEIIYLKTGKLFDGKADTFRENVIISVMRLTTAWCPGRESWPPFSRSAEPGLMP
jgi:hypothetical protein